jgi:hypothetical protein
MESGHLLDRSSPTLLEVSLMLSFGFLLPFGPWFSLFSLLIDKEAFSLHVATNFFCIPVFFQNSGYI